jgi:formylglycine-generating enzyme required for sulfatase activity
MSDIFLCYSRTDAAVANRLAGQLRAEGWTVFLDVQTQVGQRWHQAIEKELRAARAVVVLWSAISRDSDYVLEEAEYGKRQQILFPAFIERVEFPYGFSRIQTADLIGWPGTPDHPGLGQLLESLQVHLRAVTAPPSSEAAAAEPRPEPKAAPGPAPGQTFRDKLKAGGEGPLMVAVPSGRFRMGSPSDELERSDHEGPQHEVRIDQAFAMGVYAASFDEYDRYTQDTQGRKPNDKGWGRGSRPVIDVSWNDAQAYCAWLMEQTGRVYRLPSEAEWEYACRAGTTTPFYFGARLSTDQANFGGGYAGKTVPVGSFPPNAFGLYDMHGNVWEWCQDTWHDGYAGAPADGSAWQAGGEVSRVLRGGAWHNEPRFCRAANRLANMPDIHDYSFGFRVCCSPRIE